MIKYKSGLKISIISFLLITLLATPAMAMNISSQEYSINTSERFKLLNACAYTEITNKPSPEYNYSEEMQSRFLAMDDTSFKEELSASIQKTIDKQNNGAIIIWNDDFISYLQTILPNLSRTIESQNQRSIQQANIIRASSYTPGDSDETWYTYGDSFLHYHLVGFKTRIEWAWNTTQITSATPSSTGDCYAPTWTYVGITGTTQNFYNNNTRFKKWVSGKFRSAVSGTTIEERTLELTVNVYAGGSYSPISGPY